MNRRRSRSSDRRLQPRLLHSTDTGVCIHDRDVRTYYPARVSDQSDEAKIGGTTTTKKVFALIWCLKANNMPSSARKRLSCSASLRCPRLCASVVLHMIRVIGLGAIAYRDCILTRQRNQPPCIVGQRNRDMWPQQTPVLLLAHYCFVMSHRRGSGKVFVAPGVVSSHRVFVDNSCQSGAFGELELSQIT